MLEQGAGNLSMLTLARESHTDCGVSRRRIIVPGKVWALSRRTTRRHFLFTPDQARRVERAFWYSLAYAAQEYGVSVHAACLLSTHLHLVVTDVRGELPRFLQVFHRLFALSIKSIRGWPEEVFNKDATGMHELVNPESLVNALAYLMANPVAAGAVRYANEWPGAQTLPRDLGCRVVDVSRPSGYFDKANEQWPDRLQLPLEMPPGLQVEYGDERARARVEERLRRNERTAWENAKRQGLSFLGVRRVLRTAHTRRSTRYERIGSLNPQFSAAGDPEATRATIQRIRFFNAAYDDALAAWERGDREVCFPFGTWWMRVHHKARCQPPP